MSPRKVFFLSPFFFKTKTKNDLLSFQKCHSQVSRKINDFFFRSTLGHDRNLFFFKSGISFFLLIPELQTYKKCPDYKRNRKNVRDARTEKEIEEDEVFWETFDNFKDFIDQKTNCTVLQNPKLELTSQRFLCWICFHRHFLCCAGV